MKFGRKTIILTVCVALAAILPVIVLAAGSSYDNSKDPLIAQSYLDAQIAELQGKYEAEIKALEDSFNERIRELLNSSDGSVTYIESESFSSLKLENGDFIRPKDGILEIILISGRAVTVVPKNTGNIANLTNGAILQDGTSLVKNHLILIPANDGRGIKAVSSSGAEILIRGEYTVEHTN